MPKLITDVALRKAKPQDKPYKIAVSNGLYLLVNPIGSKLWRWKYRVAGKEKLLALGSYPVVSLQDARQRHEEARRLLAQGEDPSERRRAEKAARVQAEAIASDTFERVARDWMAYREAKGDTAETTAAKDRWRLEAYLFPHIGQRPITEITAIELRDVLRKAEEAGKRETASRAKITAGQVFRWAVLEGRTHSDITSSLRRLFTTPKPTHRATITDPKKIGELLRAIEGFSGQPVTQAALELAPLVFVRPGELRKAEWSEFDLNAAMWRIPGERMKMKAPHLVPLSSQAVEILRDLHGLTGHGHYVFPGVRTASRPMSENTINAALRRLGYATDEMTGHGFRSMAATRLNEMGWNADAIERQLAHAESNKVRGAYTHAAQYLEERKRMMQGWADYLAGLKAGGKVVPIKRKKG
ncbi:tyrosine-type recombinase/integrase [Dyella sp. BiH032]|uniref:tyrosine-type recombinase/integrase n=1 Tax=Dyella sp. BiH032 TaxID=3075430 RepID=UPI002893017E|nr:tyrosine-type recombinase/integrase [Dyella sp. BiH032]WNL47921.1 tyrosine-type recombinase/integrase [Dyella sp. BiH032]